MDTKTRMRVEKIPLSLSQIEGGGSICGVHRKGMMEHKDADAEQKRQDTPQAGAMACAAATRGDVQAGCFRNNGICWIHTPSVSEVRLLHNMPAL
jgi:hypothetical protein